MRNSSGTWPALAFLALLLSGCVGLPRHVQKYHSEALPNPRTTSLGRLLLRAAEKNVRNLRVICHDAVEVLRDRLRDGSFDEILVFFPDPWHKKRHHKRRLIDTAFVAELAAKLRSGGVLRLATDWQDYAEQMLAVCNADPHLASLSADRTYVPRPEFRPPTRFERRGERLGHAVWDLAFTKPETAS